MSELADSITRILLDVKVEYYIRQGIPQPDLRYPFKEILIEKKIGIVLSKQLEDMNYNWPLEDMPSYMDIIIFPDNDIDICHPMNEYITIIPSLSKGTYLHIIEAIQEIFTPH